MSEELIAQKLKQIHKLLASLEKLVNRPFEQFKEDELIFRTAERDFQLMVDIALDINGMLLLEKGHVTPDTYRQSFLQLKPLNIVAPEILDTLADSAGVRNILVHEYDFENEPKKFYYSAKTMIPAYHAYIKAILEYLKK